MVNAGTRKTCEVCSSKAPERTPLSLAVTIAGHDEFDTQPIILSELKHTITLAFLRDLLESKTGILDRNMMSQPGGGDAMGAWRTAPGPARHSLH